MPDPTKTTQIVGAHHMVQSPTSKPALSFGIHSLIFVLLSELRIALVIVLRLNSATVPATGQLMIPSKYAWSAVAQR